MSKGLPERKLYRRYLKCIFEPVFPSERVVDAFRCYLVPVEVVFDCVVDRIVSFLGGVSAGNVRAGIYRDNGDTPVGGALVVQSASVAKTGVYTTQEITIAPTFLRRGLYWLVIESDEATTKYWMESTSSFGVGVGTLSTCSYLLLGYNPFTDPCPAVAGGYVPAQWLRVALIP